MLIFIATLSLPFLAKKPIELPPIISVELIQITDQTNIPFAPKAKKTIEKTRQKQTPHPEHIIIDHHHHHRLRLLLLHLN